MNRLKHAALPWAVFLFKTRVTIKKLKCQRGSLTGFERRQFFDFGLYGIIEQSLKVKQKNMEQNQTQEQFKYKKSWIIIVLLVLVLILALLWQYKENEQLSVNEPVKNENIEVQNVSANELPAAIPENIPMEEDAVILENDIITASEKPGVTQYTRKFVSNKSLEENYAIYKDFIDFNNWEVVSSVEEETLMLLIAVNPDKTEQLFVTVSKNTINKEVTVDLTVVTQE